MKRRPPGELEALFDELRALSTAEQRERIARIDPELGAELAELLAADRPAQAFFDDLAREIAADALIEVEQAVAPLVRVGPWRALEVVGRGGMGVVYRGARVDGDFEQEVAIKLLHLDMETPELRARFRAERRLLARLSHPNIARLLDGGVTVEGRPYLVMEYVAGRPVTLYCREEALALPETIRLFLQAVAAVAYLHRNLVVHRDLKPSNVLVDERGRVALLDFGIAKLLDAEEEGLETRTGERLLTPKYASPEQLAGLPVTTASDVYSLGAILYELLAGERPRPLRAGTIRGMEPLPTPPSARHGARSAKIDRDLDAICCTALRPEPERRYASAELLAQDLERYLDGQPVAARAPTLLYRLRKLVRRRLPLVAAAGLLLLLGGLALMRERGLRQRAQEAEAAARRQAKRATAVSEFMRGMVSAADPAHAQGEEVTVMDVLERAVARLGEDNALRREPRVEAQLRRTLGETYFALGRSGDAVTQLRRADELLAGAPADDAEALAVLDALGDALRGATEYAEAEALLRQALARRTLAQGADDPATLATADRLASVLWYQRRIEETAALDRRTLAARRRTLGADHPDTLASMNSVASTLFAQSRFAEAAELYSEALDRRLPSAGDNHPEVLKLRNNLGAALVELARYREAVPLQRAVVESRHRVLGEEHPQTATAIHNLALTLLALAEYDEAERLLERAIAIRRRAPGFGELFSQSFLADLYLEQGRLAEAETLYVETLAEQRTALGPDHPDVLRTSARIAELRLRQKRLPTAETLIRDVLARQETLLPERSVGLLSSRLTLARILDAKGRHADAARLAAEVERDARSALPESHPLIADALEIRAVAAEATQSSDLARELARRCLAAREQVLGEEHPRTVRTREIARRLGA